MVVDFMVMPNVICYVRNVIVNRFQNNDNPYVSINSIQFNLPRCQYKTKLILIYLAATKKVKESPLKREVQAVKSILQGGSSTNNASRDRSQIASDSKNTKDEKKQNKKRNLLEVFKKPSSTKDAEKIVKRAHVPDKFELECLDVLKVKMYLLLNTQLTSFFQQQLFSIMTALKNTG